MTSIEKNTKTLAKAVETLYSLGRQNVIEFDLQKTELIYFLKGKDADVEVTLPDGQKVTLKVTVK